MCNIIREVNSWSPQWDYSDQKKQKFGMRKWKKNLQCTKKFGWIPLNNTNTPLSKIYAPVSLGELLDKITILEIKKAHMSGNKLTNVNKELNALKLILKNNGLVTDKNIVNQLRDINNNLWDIEDRIRIKESNQIFDNEFIQLARSVYKENDKRAFIKKEINKKYGSEFIEEKSYRDY